MGIYWHNGTWKESDVKSISPDIASLRTLGTIEKPFKTIFVDEGLVSNTLSIKDSLIDINSGDTGNGITSNIAGLKIWRGSLEPAYLVYDETDDCYKAGQISSLQRVITEDFLNQRMISSVTLNGIKYQQISGNVTLPAYPTKLPASGGDADTLDGKHASDLLSASLKGAVNGLAELDASGKIPAAQLPSYVDDVIEGTFSTFPNPGETGKIYVDTSSNKIYRWSGSSYIVISETLALGETSSTAYRGDRGKIAYDHSQSDHNFAGSSSKGGVANSALLLERINITGLTLDINTLTLSAGTPKSLHYVQMTTGGASAITNIPVSQPFLLDIYSIRYVNASDYVTKQVFTSSVDKTVYERFCTNGTFSQWLPNANFAAIPTANQVVVASDSTGGLKTTGYTIASSVPANAKFTDTTYSEVTTSSSGLMSSSDKSKLNGIKDLANKVVNSSTNGNINIDGVEQVVYTHPSSHSASEVTGLATVATSGKYTDLSNIPSSFTPSSHTHDDRYYTETEVDTKLGTKANSSHTHSNADLTGVGNGTCTTAAVTAAKVVASTGFVLTTGVIAVIKFSNGNTAANPTLNINGTGAKPIFYNGAAMPADLFSGNDIATLYYDGVNWCLAGVLNYDTSTSALTNGGIGSAGTSNRVARADHTHTLPAYPTKLPADGGDADTVDGLHASSFSLSTHTHNYAGSSSAGGAATSALTCTGNAATATTATKLATARTINGVSFDGSANITITAAASGGNADTVDNKHASDFALSTHTHSEYATKSDLGSLGYGDMMKSIYDTNANGIVDQAESVPWAGITDKPSTFTPSTHTHNYAGSSTAGGAATTALTCTGNSATATKLATARTINGVSFNGSANITITAAASDVSAWAKASTKPTYTANEIGALPTSASCNKNWSWTLKGGQPTYLWGGDDSTNMYIYNPTNFSVSYASRAGESDTAGNSATATKLATARTINGVPFDGSADITIGGNTDTTNFAPGSSGTGVNSVILNDRNNLSLGSNSLSIGKGTMAIGYNCFASGIDTVASEGGMGIIIKDNMYVTYTYNSTTSIKLVFKDDNSDWFDYLYNDGLLVPGIKARFFYKDYSNTYVLDFTLSNINYSEEDLDTFYYVYDMDFVSSTPFSSSILSKVPYYMSWNINDPYINSQSSQAEGSKTLAINCSHAEGKNSVAMGDSSHAEGSNCIASGSNSHAEGSSCTASKESSHAEGSNCTAKGLGSHAEGRYTVASGESAHSEGYYTTASGQHSHAAGTKTTASGYCSHAQGKDSIASGEYSYANGNYCEATGQYSYAIGSYCKATGNFSYAEGNSATAETYGTYSIGQNNKVNSGGSTYYMSTGNAFVIGNGSFSTKSNAFRVTFDGKTYGLSAFNSTGADYAEYFEWEDGNQNDEDRVGRFVTLIDDKIKILNSEDDYVLGIVSGNPAIIGNTSDDSWYDMYERDKFNRLIYEDKEIVIDGETKIEKRIKLNPDYDPDLAYVPRSERKEWNAIGLLGQLEVFDDGTCKINGYCKPGKNGIATSSEEGYRVIKRISDQVIKIIFK